jgi:hypothetical protein
MTSNDSVARNPNGRTRALAGFWMVYGVIRLIIVLFLVVYSSTVTLMFGALLSRVPDPFALMDLFHFLYLCMIVLSAVCAILGFVAGLALISGMQSGRKLALIAAVLSLSDIPLGVTLGIYTLVELLPIERTQSYGRSSLAA